MNYEISVLFRAIPVLMGAVSAGLGGYVLGHASGPSARVAGLVLIFLAAICLCLFATAATIIRQLIGRYTERSRTPTPRESARSGRERPPPSGPSASCGR